MPRSPSIVPKDLDEDTYIVLDASGTWGGRTWCNGEDYRETLICDLLEGRYHPPLRIVCFNSTEGWSRVVTTDIAAELQRRSAEGEIIPAFLQYLLKMPSPERRKFQELLAAQKDLAKRTEAISGFRSHLFGLHWELMPQPSLPSIQLGELGRSQDQARPGVGG
ncbi:hypothetical protein Q3C01_43025 [Bradyrhizobium sp. UFLA05-109]